MDNENDVLGAIAYSEYKRHKIETIKNFEKKHGRSPSVEDLKPFKELSNSKSQIKYYKDQAIQLTQFFIDETITQTIENELSQRVHNELLKMKPSFWNGVLQSVTASFLFVLLVGIIFFFTLSYNKGFEGAFENFCNIKIEHTQE